ncbi:MAG: hypothetical protein ACOCRO_01765 [Halanaerobiales bacterium]
MATYNPTLENIQDYLDDENISKNDTIYLPDEAIPFPIEIKRSLTIRGKENTIIDLSDYDGDRDYCIKITTENGSNETDISNVKIKGSRKEKGLEIDNFHGNVSGVEIYETDIGINIRNSGDIRTFEEDEKRSFVVSETDVYNSNIGLKMVDCQNGEFNTFNVFECEVGYDIEGSSSIVGDVFPSQEIKFSESVDENDLSGLSRLSCEIKIEPVSISSIIGKINDKLSNEDEDENEDDEESCGDYIEAFSEDIDQHILINKPINNMKKLITKLNSKLGIFSDFLVFEGDSGKIKLRKKDDSPEWMKFKIKEYSGSEENVITIGDSNFDLNIEETDEYKEEYSGEDKVNFVRSVENNGFTITLNTSNSINLRLKENDKNAKYDIEAPEDNEFGWRSGEKYSKDHIGTKNKNDIETTTDEIDTGIILKVDRKKEYSIIVGNEEYFFTCSNYSTYNSLISDLHSLKTRDDKKFRHDFNATFISKENPTIQITSLTEEKNANIEQIRIELKEGDELDTIIEKINDTIPSNYIEAFRKEEDSKLKLDIEEAEEFSLDENTVLHLDSYINADEEIESNEEIETLEEDTILIIRDIKRNNSLLEHINHFDSLSDSREKKDEIKRIDRTHHIEFITSQSYMNNVGINIVNANNLNFDNVLVYSNSDIGIWQFANSYDNEFTGEIYDNKNYGVKNNDENNEFMARQTWWGEVTGPSLFGPGDGDKVSSHVVFDAWRQDGNEPEQMYPMTRDWVWRMLGYPLVRVELSEQHISDAIDMAIDRYEEFRNPEQTYHYLPVAVGQDLVELPAWMSKKEVMDVVYSPHSDLFSQLTGAGESFYLTYYLQNTGGTFLSDFYVAMAYKETLELTLGIGPQYELFTQKNKEGEWRDYIRLSPKPSVSLQIGVLYNRPMTEEEVDSSTWIRKYALTWAKEQLGRIRSKFASVPGPTGEMQLDGQQLITEAQQERESLDQSVIQRGPPLTFDIG